MPSLAPQETLVVERCRVLGFSFSQADWQRVGFKLCLAIAWACTQRYPDTYRPSSIAAVPLCALGIADATIYSLLERTPRALFPPVG